MMKVFTRMSLAAVTLGAAGALTFGVLTAGASQKLGPTTLYVSQTGLDSGNCESASSPCATVTYALTKAVSGSTIEVSGTVVDHVTIPTGMTPITITGAQASASAPAILDGAGSGTVVSEVQSQALTLDNLSAENGNIGIDVSYNGIGTPTTVTLNNVTVSGNSDVDGGGGIENFGTLTVNNSTISGNHSDNEGGGIYNKGPLTLVKSTITGNVSDNYGGGIFAAAGDPVTIIGTTITGNTGSTGNGGGIENNDASIITLGATIVAGNTGGNCVFGGFISIGYNVTDDTTGAACGLTESTDIVNKNPDLGKLAKNGGPTETVLPASTSPAADVIPETTKMRGVAICPGLDQRGYARPAKGETRCTIGADEAHATGKATTTSARLLPNSITVGRNVVYLATVAPKSGTGTPTGMVRFKIGSTTLCVATLSGGSGACGATNAPIGKDTVTAQYSGDPYFADSAGSTTLDVRAATKVALTSSANPVSTGTKVTYTAAVSPVPDGGTMEFTSGGTAIAGCTANTVNTTTGKATCTVTYSTSGTYKIQALYSGDTDFAPSNSTTLTETVT